MKYTPDAVNPADLDIVEAPYFGGEFAVLLANKPAVLLGEIDMTASGTGAYAVHNGASISAGGGDLQLVADSDLRSEVNLVVRFACIDDLGGNTTAIATVSPAARAANQSSHFPCGVAVDFVVGTGATRKVASLTSLTSITGGDRNVVLKVFQLPEAADYTLVGCTTGKKFNTKAREPKGVNCGMKRDAFVKAGMTGAGDLTIDSKYGGMHDRLARFNGKKVTAMLIGIKDGVVLTERLVFTQYRPMVNFDLPDADGEAQENAATGKFVDHLFFTAP